MSGSVLSLPNPEPVRHKTRTQFDGGRRYHRLDEGCVDTDLGGGIPAHDPLIPRGRPRLTLVVTVRTPLASSAEASVPGVSGASHRRRRSRRADRDRPGLPLQCGWTGSMIHHPWLPRHGMCRSRYRVRRWNHADSRRRGTSVRPEHLRVGSEEQVPALLGVNQSGRFSG